MRRVIYQGLAGIFVKKTFKKARERTEKTILMEMNIEKTEK